ncbi:hypothetical protein HWV62_10937 [Athelia sp. TMB]|nr:hypothetical protein HWV62_10937 [Athelia sp. TMB]
MRGASGPSPPITNQQNAAKDSHVQANYDDLESGPLCERGPGMSKHLLWPSVGRPALRRPLLSVGTSGSKCYWREDIVAMSKQFADYRKAVAMGKSGAKKALDDFTTSRLVLAAQTTVAARNCKEWLVTRAEAAKVAKHQLREKRYHDIRQRLLALGHDEKDMHRLHTLPVVDKNSELTERSWNTMRKAIEGHVNHVRATRIQRERLPLLRSRMDVIKSVYNDYKATAVPATWSYQPADEVAQRLPCFAALIDDPSDLPLDVQRCREALKYLPSDVDALNEEKTAVLLSLLVRSSERTAASVADDAGSALDLATTIFICQGRYCGGGSEPFIGWQHAICHRCQIGPFQSAEEVRIPEFRFALQASKAVCSLASLLGLDAGVVTPQDLDRADGRFVCLTCPLATYHNPFARRALSWGHCASLLPDTCLNPKID